MKGVVPMNRRPLSFAILLTAMSFAVAAAGPALAAQASDYSYARVVRLSLAEGEVQVARATQSWEAAIVNLPIQQGYSVATGRGRAEIEFESGATARLADNSLLHFSELALSSGARLTKLTLTQGTASFYANLAREDSFVVATPHLQVTLERNARFRVDATNDSSFVSVLKGEVEVSSRAGTERLTKGHALSYSTSDPDRVTLGRSPREDGWDRWVADRDEVIHTRSSEAARYVNSPYRYGFADLSSYGTWYYIGGYGHCWRPFGIGSHWFPFWDGRWVFYPGLGWTWVSYEPWGWLPYHFGRWIFTAQFGWAWVPGYFHYWHPAPVQWMQVRDVVGWVPLAPGDQPGQTPTNLQKGLVVNTKAGFSAAKPKELIHSDASDQILLLKEPPAEFAHKAAATPENIRGSQPAAAPPGWGTAPPGIVYDSKERKYVNDPAPPARTDDRPADAQPLRDEAVLPRDGAGGKTPPSPAQPAKPHEPWSDGPAPPQPPANPEVAPRPGRAPAPPSSPYGPAAPVKRQPRWDDRSREVPFEGDVPFDRGKARPPRESPGAMPPSPEPRGGWDSKPPQPRTEAPRPASPPPMSAPEPKPAPREQERPQKPQ